MKSRGSGNRKIGGIVRYPGGKSKLWHDINKRLVRMLGTAAHITEYREPFFGAGAVGLSFLTETPEIRRAWLNDADPGMAALWDTILKNPTSLHVMIECLPEAMRIFPTSDYYSAYVRLLKSLPDRVKHRIIPAELLSMAKIVAHQMSFSGLGPQAGGPMADIFARYKVEPLVQKIYACHELLGSVTLRHNTCTCLDFDQMFDPGEAIFYLDPPYYAAGPQLYQFAFEHRDHLRLAHTLQRESRPWLLSYDDHPEIRKLYESWTQIDTVQVGCSINGCNRKNELLISNCV